MGVCQSLLLADNIQNCIGFAATADSTVDDKIAAIVHLADR
jgi:hypothetical protein